MKHKYLLLLLVALTLLGCSSQTQSQYKQTLKISSVFDNGGTIPKKYTCDGADISPPLIIQNIPKNTKSLVIICVDVDAPMGQFYHWIAWNVDPRNYIPPNIPKKKYVTNPIRMTQGINDFKKIGYDGPCPPPGKPHRYYFKIYALDTVLSGYYNKNTIMNAIRGHVIAYGEIYGIYQR